MLTFASDGTVSLRAKDDKVISTSASKNSGIHFEEIDSNRGAVTEGLASTLQKSLQYHYPQHYLCHEDTVKWRGSDIELARQLISQQYQDNSFTPTIQFDSTLTGGVDFAGWASRITSEPTAREVKLTDGYLPDTIPSSGTLVFEGSGTGTVSKLIGSGLTCSTDLENDSTPVVGSAGHINDGDGV